MKNTYALNWTINFEKGQLLWKQIKQGRLFSLNFEDVFAGFMSVAKLGSRMGEDPVS